MPGLIPALFNKGLLPDVEYDAIIDSSQTGYIKPEPEIYELAAEKTGIKPESLLLVDDSRSNLMAAARLGWHVLWFDDNDPEESVSRIKKTLEF
jgi:FMN phosphatase YigB (HAD superfamily)